MATDDEDELTVEDLEDSEESGDSEESSDPTWGASIVVNNVTYAVSLFWQPLQNPTDPYPEVKETVENVMEGADLFCTRSGTSPQYGIGNSAEGHKVGMPSAAAAIAELFQDKPSSVAVFEVDEGWWFIAVRNDLILSEEDILYLKEDDAKKAFYAMMAVPDWGRKIAPASWEIEGTEEVDLWDLLKNPGTAKLMHINRTNPKMKLVFLGAGLLLLFAGWNLVSGMFGTTKKKPVIRPLAPVKTYVEEEEEEKVVVENKAVARPWETLVVTEDLMNRCQIAIIQLKSIVVPGWEMGDISCSATGASVTWSMKWGDLGWLKRAFQEYDIRGLDYLIDNTGQSALVSLAIGNIAVHSETPKIMAYEAREELTNIFQATGLPISLKDERTTRVQKVDKNGLASEISEIKTYPKLLFSFNSELPMEAWLGLFNKFPALELTLLKYHPKSNSWTYEGRIYEPLY